MFDSAKWQNLKEIFDKMNDNINYVVLRNFAELPQKYIIDEHGDIDIMVDNPQKLICFLRQNNEMIEEYPSHINIETKEGEVLFHIKYLCDGYFDTKMQQKMLETRNLNKNGIYIPNEEYYFYSLLYHAIYQKPKISETYIKIFKESFERKNLNYPLERKKLKKLLDDWLSKNGFNAVRDLQLITGLHWLYHNDKKQYKQFNKIKPKVKRQEEEIFFLSNDNEFILIQKRLLILAKKFCKHAFDYFGAEFAPVHYQIDRGILNKKIAHNLTKDYHFYTNSINLLPDEQELQSLYTYSSFKQKIRILANILMLNKAKIYKLGFKLFKKSNGRCK